MHGGPELSIIIPAYNESATIVRTLTLARDYLESKQTTFEIIVSADGSDSRAGTPQNPRPPRDLRADRRPATGHPDRSGHGGID